MTRAADPGLLNRVVSLACGVGLGAVLLASPILANDEAVEIYTVSASIAANGTVEYELAGKLSYLTSVQNVGLVVNLRFKGKVAYNPAGRQAAEWLSMNADNDGVLTRSKAICLSDPWLIGGACSNGQFEGWSFGYDSFPAPITASRMSAGDRDKVRAAFEQAQRRKNEQDAAAKRAEADRVAAEIYKKKEEFLETPVSSAGLKPDPNVQKFAFAGATPTQVLSKHKAPSHNVPVAPLYGAEYIAGATTVKANQIVTVPVSIENLSSMNWPANGNFQLSYHWVQGANVVVLNGERTAMPSAVPPGGAIAISARLKGPPAPGLYTLKWDMVQDAATWFSNKGVPTNNQSVTAAQ